MCVSLLVGLAPDSAMLRFKKLTTVLTSLIVFVFLFFSSLFYLPSLNLSFQISSFTRFECFGEMFENEKWKRKKTMMDIGFPSFYVQWIPKLNREWSRIQIIYIYHRYLIFRFFSFSSFVYACMLSLRVGCVFYTIYFLFI